MNKYILWNFVMIILMFDYGISVRNLKRKGAFIPNKRHANPRTTIAAEPYKYEAIQAEDISNAQLKYGHVGSQHSSYSGTYLIDNGLRNIAKGSANQASTAVASQNAAAKQAAFLVKSNLAKTASQAASTALAALKGKQALLQRLEEHYSEANKALQNELIQLQQAKRSAKAAQLSTEQAFNHVTILMAALNNAQTASQLAEKAAAEAAAELASQIDMVAQANSKLEQLASQLYAAHLDYEETKDAAEKANSSAQEAQNNANDAGVYANLELNGSTSPSLHTLDKRTSDSDQYQQQHQQQQQHKS